MEVVRNMCHRRDETATFAPSICEDLLTYDMSDTITRPLISLTFEPATFDRLIVLNNSVGRHVVETTMHGRTTFPRSVTPECFLQL